MSKWWLNLHFWVNYPFKNVFCLLQMLTDGLEWCGLLWCFYQTLILTAPIHCRASIAETLMQRHISTNLSLQYLSTPLCSFPRLLSHMNVVFAARLWRGFQEGRDLSGPSVRISIPSIRKHLKTNKHLVATFRSMAVYFQMNDSRSITPLLMFHRLKVCEYPEMLQGSRTKVKCVFPTNCSLKKIFYLYFT